MRKEHGEWYITSQTRVKPRYWDYMVRPSPQRTSHLPYRCGGVFIFVQVWRYRIELSAAAPMEVNQILLEECNFTDNREQWGLWSFRRGYCFWRKMSKLMPNGLFNEWRTTNRILGLNLIKTGNRLKPSARLLTDQGKCFCNLDELTFSVADSFCNQTVVFTTQHPEKVLIESY